MTTVEFLKNAKARIADEKNWCRVHLAMNACKEFVQPSSPRAVCWCSLGTVYLESRLLEYQYQVALAEELRDRAEATLSEAVAEITNSDALEKSTYTSIPIYNDDHSHEEVMKMWDKAIEIAEREETDLDDSEADIDG